MLRLGSKYDFEHLRQEALFRLRADFPTSLDAWDEAIATGAHTHITGRPGLIVDVINLALEQDLFSILPSAYYACVEEDANIVRPSLESCSDLPLSD